MTIKEMRSTIDALAAAYQDTRDNGGNPDTAARGFIHAVGAEEAAQCVAAMVRRAAWDGRISREAKAWAQGMKLSCEWERHIEDTYCDAIHPAHLSQIAEAMPKELEARAAEQEEPQEEPQEELQEEPKKAPAVYMAIDQYGTTYHGLKHPRKDLLERLGYTHARKMYRDKKDGSTVHVGYVIGGLWLTLYRVEPVENPA